MKKYKKFRKKLLKRIRRILWIFTIVFLSTSFIGLILGRFKNLVILSIIVSSICLLLLIISFFPSIPKLIFLGVFRIFYWIFKGLFLFFELVFNAFKKKIKEKRKVIKKEIDEKIYNSEAKYERFKIVKKINGDFDEFEKKLLNDSVILLIFGRRGSGKSALGFKILENVYYKTKRKCYALGVKQEVMPKWIKSIDNINNLEEGSVVLVDEGAVAFSSRESMRKKNRDLSSLLTIARHKNLSIIFITQNTGLIDTNILKLTDILFIKQGSLLQQEMERKEIKKFYEKAEKVFKKLQGKKIKYVYIIDSNFEGVVETTLPNFWSDKLSRNRG